MTLFKRVIWLAFFLLPLASCSPTSKRSFYPEEIMGDSIAFYTTNTQIPDDKYLVKKDILYRFHRNGAYTSTLDGEMYELGNYSYHLKKHSNQATLILSYSGSDDIHSTYTISMKYKSAYAGSFEIVISDGRNGMQKEFGTFRFLK